MDNQESMEIKYQEEENVKDSGNEKIKRLEERLQVLEKWMQEKDEDSRIQALEKVKRKVKDVGNINRLEERLQVLEKGMQEQDKDNRIQALEKAVKILCLVVDVVMKRAIMATISGMGKIKKQQKKKATSKGVDLSGKMELNEIVDNIVEDLLTT